MLVDFCTTKLMANTWFTQYRTRRRYTWTKPGDTRK